MEKIQNILNLSGKTAIVTGGAVGIGYGIACRLAEAGANVMIADLNSENALKAKVELQKNGWKVDFVEADVSNEESVGNLIKKTVEVFGGVDILVNNAGIYPHIVFKDMSLGDFNKVIDVNLGGVFLCTKKAAEQMILQGRGGKIINITSVDALHPSSVGLSHYDASKHGVWGFTKNVALELAAHKIWVNAIAPGGVETPGVEAFEHEMGLEKNAASSDLLDSFLARIPMKRMGEPDDIAKAALFLASDMSSYMTGAQIVVDGGYLIS